MYGIEPDLEGRSWTSQKGLIEGSGFSGMVGVQKLSSVSKSAAEEGGRVVVQILCDETVKEIEIKKKGSLH